MPRALDARGEGNRESEGIQMKNLIQALFALAFGFAVLFVVLGMAHIVRSCAESGGEVGKDEQRHGSVDPVDQPMRNLDLPLEFDRMQNLMADDHQAVLN